MANAFTLCKVEIIPALCFLGGCANISCQFYSVCKSQGIGQSGICVCPSDCIEEDQDVVIVESEAKKVCGTDGQTYPSECHMKIAACKKQQYIVVANKGDCGKILILIHFHDRAIVFLDFSVLFLSTPSSHLVLSVVEIH